MRMTQNKPIPRDLRAGCVLQHGSWSVKDRSPSGRTVE